VFLWRYIVDMGILGLYSLHAWHNTASIMKGLVISFG